MPEYPQRGLREMQPSHVPYSWKYEGYEGGGLREPWVDPTSVFSVGAGTGLRAGLQAGKAILPAAMQGLRSGLAGAGMDYPVGVATEQIAGEYPSAALPLNIALGVLSGKYVEPKLEKLAIKATPYAKMKLAEQRGSFSTKPLEARSIPIEMEARKYKTSEDFIKAQGDPVYHGTPAEFDSFEFKKSKRSYGSLLEYEVEPNAIFFTKDKGSAWEWAENRRGTTGNKPRIVEAYPSVKNTIDLTNDNITNIWVKSKSQSGRDIETTLFEYLRDRDPYFSKWTPQHWAEVGIDMNNSEVVNPQNINMLLDEKPFVDALKRFGYDSAKLTEGEFGKFSGESLAVLDISKVKTKSQLEDIWEKANKPTPQITRAKRPLEKKSPLTERFAVSKVPPEELAKANADPSYTPLEKIVGYVDAMGEGEAQKLISQYHPSAMLSDRVEDIAVASKMGDLGLAKAPQSKAIDVPFKEVGEQKALSSFTKAEALAELKRRKLLK